MALGLQGGYSLDGLSGWCATPGVDSAMMKRRGVPEVLDITAVEGSGSGSALDLGHPREVVTDVAHPSKGAIRSIRMYKTDGKSQGSERKKPVALVALRPGCGARPVSPRRILRLPLACLAKTGDLQPVLIHAKVEPPCQSAQ
jgi:hypothetical protein